MTQTLLKTSRRQLAALLPAMAPALLPAQTRGITVDPPQGDDICPFSTLDLSKVTCFDDGGKTQARANLSTYGEAIVLRDTTYTSGVGVHAPSKAVIAVNGATRFTSRLGVDDAAKQDPDHGIVGYTISVYKNRKQTVVQQGRINRTDAFTVPVDIDLAGCDYLVLDLDNAGVAWADHASWANAVFTYSGQKPVTLLESDMYRDESKIVNIPEAPEGMEHIALSSLEIGKATCGWGSIKADRSIEGNPILLKDTTYTSGVGTHSPSQIIVKLNGSVTRFVTRVGVDDEVMEQATGNPSHGKCNYRVTLKDQDGETYVVSQGTIKATDTTTPLIDVNVAGWKYLFLEVTDGDGGNAADHVDWAGAYFVYEEQNSSRPVIVSAEEIASNLDCPVTMFSQPGVRYMHKIRATNPDAIVAVDNLPAGLKWNEKRHIVEGIIEQEGVYKYNIQVTLEGKTTDNPVTLTVSAHLPQPVPFMGWLSWNTVQGDISEEAVRQAADFFDKSGLKEYGWDCIIMDDLWHADKRASDGKPLPNPQRFPNGVKAAADYVHAKGMKFGLYTDAADYTCGGAFGSYGYEEIDANEYAKWGVDFVKCDYCGAPGDVESAKERYKALGDALQNSGRNMILCICEWGPREPWKWGAEVGGSCWRTTYDVRDCWTPTSPAGVGVLQSIDGMKSLSSWQGVNRFNDADMLCLGLHGTGKPSNAYTDGNGMTMDEYRTQYALWCMWSSPMALSFDPRKELRAADMAIITNRELIALNQDKMGQQADLVLEQDNVQLYAKDLENGDVALAVVNLGDKAAKFTIDFSQVPALYADTTYTCRDLWAQAAMDDVKGKMATTVKSHATMVFRLSPKYLPTGIGSPLSDKGFDVKAAGDGVSISCPGTAGLEKRVIVSDMGGRVVASTTSRDEEISLTLPAPRGIYAVSVTCGAQATARKVMF